MRTAKGTFRYEKNWLPFIRPLDTFTTIANPNCSGRAVTVDSLTDVVYVSVPDVTSESGLSSAFVSSFKGARDLVGGAIGDKELENKVRENFDVYAMALPYHIIFKDKKVEQPPVTVARRSVPEPDPQPEVPVAPRSGEYSNSRFGYTIAIPPGFVAGDEPTNGDGIRYTSADGQATLTMVGSNTGGTTIKQYYDDLSTGIGAQPPVHLLRVLPAEETELHLVGPASVERQ